MPDTADEAAIRSLVETWAAAVRRRDLEAVMRHHTPDLLMFDVPPPFESRGLEAYRESWKVFYHWARDPVRFDIRSMDVVAGADVAVVMCAMQCAGTETSGKDIDLDFRLTLGLRKIDGQWAIFHEHHSIPAES
ncbi:MAG TPA: SgcJ/EcaC family oxidoreductase [Caulobacteraceae bacterium]|jgi:uncharacterized protein (TIGR02246 family)